MHSGNSSSLQKNSSWLLLGTRWLLQNLLTRKRKRFPKHAILATPSFLSSYWRNRVRKPQKGGGPIDRGKINLHLALPISIIQLSGIPQTILSIYQKTHDPNASTTLKGFFSSIRNWSGYIFQLSQEFFSNIKVPQ